MSITISIVVFLILYSLCFSKIKNSYLKAAIPIICLLAFYVLLYFYNNDMIYFGMTIFTFDFTYTVIAMDNDNNH